MDSSKRELYKDIKRTGNIELLKRLYIEAESTEWFDVFKEAELFKPEYFLIEYGIETAPEIYLLDYLYKIVDKIEKKEIYQIVNELLLAYNKSDIRDKINIPTNQVFKLTQKLPINILSPDFIVMVVKLITSFSYPVHLINDYFEEWKYDPAILSIIIKELFTVKSLEDKINNSHVSINEYEYKEFAADIITKNVDVSIIEYLLLQLKTALEKEGHDFHTDPENHFDNIVHVNISNGMLYLLDHHILGDIKTSQVIKKFELSDPNNIDLVYDDFLYFSKTIPLKTVIGLEQFKTSIYSINSYFSLPLNSFIDSTDVLLDFISNLFICAEFKEPNAKLLTQIINEDYYIFKKLALYVAAKDHNYILFILDSLKSEELFNILTNEYVGSELREFLKRLEPKEFDKYNLHTLIEKVINYYNTEYTEMLSSEIALSDVKKQKLFEAIKHIEPYLSKYEEYKRITGSDLNLDSVIINSADQGVKNVIDRSPINLNEMFKMSETEIVGFINTYEEKKSPWELDEEGNYLAYTKDALDNVFEEFCKRKIKNKEFIISDYIDLNDISFFRIIKSFYYFKSEYGRKWLDLACDLLASRSSMESHWWYLFEEILIEEVKTESNTNEIMNLIQYWTLNDKIDSKIDRIDSENFITSTSSGVTSVDLLTTVFNNSYSKIIKAYFDCIKIEDKITENQLEFIQAQIFSNILAANLFGFYLHLFFRLNSSWTKQIIQEYQKNRGNDFWLSFIDGYLYNHSINKDIYTILNNDLLELVKIRDKNICNKDYSHNLGNHLVVGYAYSLIEENDKAVEYVLENIKENARIIMEFIRWYRVAKQKDTIIKSPRDFIIEFYEEAKKQNIDKCENAEAISAVFELTYLIKVIGQIDEIIYSIMMYAINTGRNKLKWSAHYILSELEELSKSDLDDRELRYIFLILYQLILDNYHLDDKKIIPILSIIKSSPVAEELHAELVNLAIRGYN